MSLKRFVLCGLVLTIALVISACAPAAAPAAATEAPAAEPAAVVEPAAAEPAAAEPAAAEPAAVVESPAAEAPAAGSGSEGWDGGYGLVPPELCPPDGPVTGSPLFEPVVREVDREDGRIYVRQGLFVNKKGALFSIDVVGPDTELVRAYTDEVQVCFDNIDFGEERIESSEPASGEVGSGGALTTLILMGFEGQLGVDGQAAYDITGEAVTGSVPADWLNVLADTAKLNVPSQQTSMFDFIVDPGITGSARPHQYREKSGSGSAYSVTVSVKDGGGSVTGTLCQVTSGGSTMKNSVTVTKGGVEAGSMSFSSGKFDLGVDGLQPTNTYKVSGRWELGYNANPPSGGANNCPP